MNANIPYADWHRAEVKKAWRMAALAWALLTLYIAANLGARLFAPPTIIMRHERGVIEPITHRIEQRIDFAPPHDEGLRDPLEYNAAGQGRDSQSGSEET